MNAYPTRYSELTSSEVNALFRSSSWDSLSGQERLDALQELENRASLEQGNQPCEIRLESMSGSTYGWYSDGVISINQNLVENGEFVQELQDGTTISYAPEDVNAQLMDTVHHENYHAYQDDVINERVESADQDETALWRANDENYIEEQPYYRIQSLERTAFDQGETKTKEAFQEIETKYGEDAGYQEYLASIDGQSYERALAEAQLRSGDENIQQSIDQGMLSQYAENHAEYSMSEASVADSSEANESGMDSAGLDDASSSGAEAGE